jgi:large subunit ribosomal protein L31
MAKLTIQPTWYDDAAVTCACGNTFTTGSTVLKIQVEICAKCHPFFTGQQKFVDTLGQVDKFQKKTEVSKEKMAQKKAILQARAAKVQAPTDKPSLKDLLMQARKNLNS